MKNDAEQPQHSKLGLQLFTIYTLFYAGFVLVNAFVPSWSEWAPFGGLNLAIWWGFGLILFAFVLSMIYGLFASDPAENEAPNEEQT